MASLQTNMAKNTWTYDELDDDSTVIPNTHVANTSDANISDANTSNNYRCEELNQDNSYEWVEEFSKVEDLEKFDPYLPPIQYPNMDYGFQDGSETDPEMPDLESVNSDCEYSEQLTDQFSSGGCSMRSKSYELPGNMVAQTSGPASDILPPPPSYLESGNQTNYANWTYDELDDISEWTPANKSAPISQETSFPKRRKCPYRSCSNHSDENEELCSICVIYKDTGIAIWRRIPGSNDTECLGKIDTFLDLQPIDGYPDLYMSPFGAVVAYPGDLIAWLQIQTDDTESLDQTSSKDELVCNVIPKKSVSNPANQSNWHTRFLDTCRSLGATVTKLESDTSSQLSNRLSPHSFAIASEPVCTVRWGAPRGEHRSSVKMETDTSNSVNQSLPSFSQHPEQHKAQSWAFERLRNRNRRIEPRTVSVPCPWMAQQQQSEPVSLRMSQSIDGREYLSIPSVFKYISLGGYLEKTDLLQLGSLIKESIYPKDNIPAFNRVIIRNRFYDEKSMNRMDRRKEISIVRYGWSDYPMIAKVCMDWMIKNPTTVKF